MSDPALQGLAQLANDGGLTVSITLVVDGQFVEGTLTSVTAWKESFDPALQDSPLLPALVKVANASEDCIHIKPTRVYGSGDSVEYNVNVVLRFALSAVSGWHFGARP